MCPLVISSGNLWISFLSDLTCMLIMLPVFFVSASSAVVAAYLGLSRSTSELLIWRALSAAKTGLGSRSWPLLLLCERGSPIALLISHVMALVSLVAWVHASLMYLIGTVGEVWCVCVACGTSARVVHVIMWGVRINQLRRLR